MARFGRNSARQRLRRATRQALSAPAFDTPADCTPWVIGGLWPAELETVTPQTAMVAEYLKNDLERIANSANVRIHNLRHAHLGDDARRVEEARIINVARAFAVLRVESTVRQLSSEAMTFESGYASLTTAPEPPAPFPEPFDATQLIEFSEDAVMPADSHDDTAPEPLEPDAASEPTVAETEPEYERLARLLDFMARQVPSLRWAVGDRADGTTVLVTDLAHGWIPPGVTLPVDVKLLAPAKRTGRIRELLGDVARSVAYRGIRSVAFGTTSRTPLSRHANCPRSTTSVGSSARRHSGVTVCRASSTLWPRQVPRAPAWSTRRWMSCECIQTPRATSCLPSTPTSMQRC